MSEGKSVRAWRAAAFAAALLIITQTAHAGDQPLYAPSPDWIKIAPLPDTVGPEAGGGPVVIDVQQRIDGATVWNYSDTTVRLDTPEALSQSSSITLAWSPDKGDLIIHQLTIMRDGQAIDALAGDKKFTVLRREQQLEQRELTGILSATLAVEGLRVGDMLRLRVSATAADTALGGRAQLVHPLIAEPVRVQSAGYELSWRAADKTQWKVYADNVDPKPRRNGAFTELPLALPAPRQPEMPGDAPGRFQRMQLIEASTFADWADVSRVMAPLYATQGTLAANSALAAEVATIIAATDDPMRRTAMALQLVQDKVRFLAVGMDGGNYRPQSPDKTWDVRYGDCKAKTLLLLAMLHAMGITAEPVLAHVGLGDLVPSRVPSALAFNHVLVRATIGDDTLWLDGTGLGTRLADLRDTPALGHVLPVRAEGAELIRIALRPPARPTVELSMEADESTSIDLPSVIDLAMVVRGQLASLLTLAASQLPEKELRAGYEVMMQEFVGDAQYDMLTGTADVENGTVTLKGRGVFNTGWRLQDRRTERWLSRVPGLVEFEPDRARPAWADIPVATGEPDLMRYRMRVRLPDGGKGYAIEGDEQLDTQIAGRTIRRALTIADGIVTVDETLAASGTEIPAAAIASERDRVATTLSRSPRMIAPDDAVRRWNLDSAPSASQLDAIKAVYAKAVADADEDNITALESSFSFHRGIGDFKTAEAMLTRQLAILPSAEAYIDRANVRVERGDLAGALSDAEAARKLDPASVIANTTVALFTAELGDVSKATALLDERIALGGKTRYDYRLAKASMLGDFGSAEDAIAEFDALVVEKPGSPDLLNRRCWAKATRNVQIETALKDCTSALELSDSTAGILDSRALVWLRLDRAEDALRDLDAALLQAPGMTAGRFLRAIVNKRLGFSDQAAHDLAIARRMTPSLERSYARFGLKP
ncbi:DUF3857 domain-containing protein [Blastomonas sp.]|uniref:DUF3857 domain-containing protein n=1 Tax=Blastomonas sp. TaxID=1909299 RepID=UPI0035943BE7